MSSYFALSSPSHSFSHCADSFHFLSESVWSVLYTELIHMKYFTILWFHFNNYYMLLVISVFVHSALILTVFHQQIKYEYLLFNIIILWVSFDFLNIKHLSLNPLSYICLHYIHYHLLEKKSSGSIKSFWTIKIKAKRKCVVESKTSGKKLQGTVYVLWYNTVNPVLSGTQSFHTGMHQKATSHAA